MKIPRTFLNTKGLEEKIEQLFQTAKKPHPEGDVKTYADGEIEDFFRMFTGNPYDYLGNYCCLEKLLGYVGYEKLDKKSPKNEYWSKKTNDAESFVLVVTKAHNERHYSFARLKSSNVNNFCNKYEIGRRLSDIGPVTITGVSVPSGAAVVLATAYYLDTTVSKLATSPELLDLMPAGLGIVSMLFVSLGMLYLSDYLKDRYVTKWIKNNCTGFIQKDDEKALRAAFS